ncbi:hypothetical protein DFH09DRAFT_1088145 [Mycena vulgaris]|nr:hypothetical protein DFH09DRAFT_1088145 [Mycena vulgaris]
MLPPARIRSYSVRALCAVLTMLTARRLRPLEPLPPVGALCIASLLPVGARTASARWRRYRFFGVATARGRIVHCYRPLAPLPPVSASHMASPRLRATARSCVLHRLRLWRRCHSSARYRPLAHRDRLRLLAHRAPFPPVGAAMSTVRSFRSASLTHRALPLARSFIPVFVPALAPAQAHRALVPDIVPVHSLVLAAALARSLSLASVPRALVPVAPPHSHVRSVPPQRAVPLLPLQRPCTFFLSRGLALARHYFRAHAQRSSPVRIYVTPEVLLGDAPVFIGSCSHGT